MKPRRHALEGGEGGSCTASAHRCSLLAPGWRVLLRPLAAYEGVVCLLVTAWRLRGCGVQAAMLNLLVVLLSEGQGVITFLLLGLQPEIVHDLWVLLATVKDTWSVRTILGTQHADLADSPQQVLAHGGGAVLIDAGHGRADPMRGGIYRLGSKKHDDVADSSAFVGTSNHGPGSSRLGGVNGISKSIGTLGKTLSSKFTQQGLASLRGLTQLRGRFSAQRAYGEPLSKREHGWERLHEADELQGTPLGTPYTRPGAPCQTASSFESVPPTPATVSGNGVWIQLEVPPVSTPSAGSSASSTRDVRPGLAPAMASSQRMQSAIRGGQQVDGAPCASSPSLGPSVDLLPPEAYVAALAPAPAPAVRPGRGAQHAGRSVQIMDLSC